MNCIRGFRWSIEEVKDITKNQSYILRGIASFSVIISHYAKWYISNGEYTIIAQLLGTIGRYGVAIFLFLSGYGLSCSVYKRGIIDKSFIYKRFINVYCPYLIIGFIFALINHIEITNYDIMKYIFALDNWYIATISAFYIFFYISYRYMFRFRIHFLAVCIVLYSLLTFWANLNEAWYLSNACFVMGVLYAEFIKGKEDSNFQKWLCNLLIFKNKEKKSLRFLCLVFIILYPTYLILELMEISIYLIVKVLISIVFINLLILYLKYFELCKFQFSKYCGIISLELFLIHENWLYWDYISNLDRATKIIVSLILTFISAITFNKIYSYVTARLYLIVRK